MSFFGSMVQKVAYALPILIALVAIDMTVAINFLRLSTVNNLHAAPLIPNAIFLWRALKTNNHTMVYRIFMLNTGTMISWLIAIIVMAFTVFYPKNMASDYVTLLCDSDSVGKQLAILLMILIFAIHFYLMVYLNWNLLFHAAYMCHMNTNMCAHTADCPGLGDYDPQWHRIKP
uniref:G_PROTEIN_RECEP_F1_2 domain-containing protein n=1 Tax=Panagrellus redivivus TaxID=6233 RepID=A0A7E4VJD7_PANRE